MPRRGKIASIGLIISFCLALVSCNSIFTSKPKMLMTIPESGALAPGYGAVMVHAVNRGSLVATRWLKVDQPNVKESFTVFRSSRHRTTDKMDTYDVVMVPAGTYALYSVYSNCPEGIRPYSTDWDELLRDSVATPLGMVTWLRRWTQYQATGYGVPGVGIGIGGGIGTGGSGGGVGLGIGIGLGNSDPGLPVATCNLLNTGIDKRGQPLLAAITVKPGELVYAGELTVDFSADANCQESGNWMVDGQMSAYCGAAWMTLDIADAYESQARPFMEKNLSPTLLSQLKPVVRLATPGTLVNPLPGR